jgi:hypothetical protein
VYVSLPHPYQQTPCLNFHLHVLAPRFFCLLNPAFILTSRNRFPLISLPSGEAKQRWESFVGLILLLAAGEVGHCLETHQIHSIPVHDPSQLYSRLDLSIERQYRQPAETLVPARGSFLLFWDYWRAFCLCFCLFVHGFKVEVSVGYREDSSIPTYTKRVGLDLCSLRAAFLLFSLSVCLLSVRCLFPYQWGLIPRMGRTHR